jgi:hypothetical protein
LPVEPWPWSRASKSCRSAMVKEKGEGLVGVRKMKVRCWRVRELCWP